MSSILNFKESCSLINLKLRATRIGPEWNLVQDFSEYIVELFENKNNRLAVFYEPLLDSGFPDIVIAEFDEKAYINWSVIRNHLKPIDFKILNHVYAVKETDLISLKYNLGYSSKELNSSITNLYDSKFINITKNYIKAKRKSSVFGVKSIFAFEAKMNDWQSAFQQALVNKWFASESYILSPVLTPSQKTVGMAEKNGIGIYTLNDTVNLVCKAEKRSIPSCYAAWLFNEWIGRRLNQTDVSN